MSWPVSSSSFHFPSQDIIVSYLEHHPYTRGSYLTENRIIETVARFFAGQTIPDFLEEGEDKVDRCVKDSLAGLMETLILPGDASMAIHAYLSKALKDCARGKAIV